MEAGAFMFEGCTAVLEDSGGGYVTYRAAGLHGELS